MVLVGCALVMVVVALSGRSRVGCRSAGRCSSVSWWRPAASSSGRSRASRANCSTPAAGRRVGPARCSARRTSCARSPTARASLHWLGWFTPLGWTERIEPFTRPNSVADRASSLGRRAVCSSVSRSYLREQRDTGAGLVGARVGRGRPAGHAVRRSALDWHLSTGALLAWAAGIFVGLFVLGYLTHDMVAFRRREPDDRRHDRPGSTGSRSGTGAGSSASPSAWSRCCSRVYAGTHMLVRARGRGRRPGRQSRRRRHQPGCAGSWRGSAVALVAMLVLALVAAARGLGRRERERLVGQLARRGRRVPST